MENVRRCTPCNLDWPPIPLYNLCPRCLKNTYASTSDEKINYVVASVEAARLKTIHEFDAKADKLHDEAAQVQIAELNALFAAPAYDHPDHPASNVPDGLERLKPVTEPNSMNPQSVDYKRPPNNYGLAGDA